MFDPLRLVELSSGGGEGEGRTDAIRQLKGHVKARRAGRGSQRVERIFNVDSLGPTMYQLDLYHFSSSISTADPKNYRAGGDIACCRVPIFLSCNFYLVP